MIGDFLRNPKSKNECAADNRHYRLGNARLLLHWNYLREQVRPNVAQSRPSVSCKSIAIRRAQELDWLLYGIVLVDRPVTWRDVISKHEQESAK